MPKKAREQPHNNKKIKVFQFVAIPKMQSMDTELDTEALEWPQPTPPTTELLGPDSTCNTSRPCPATAAYRTSPSAAENTDVEATA
mmetsp:Transcript_61846/g.110140  ORF Transcript_61846/g.110140 Transcript_61846/m.110140 type:complete len:86 (+) Transcript_61846:493-750(+)